MSVSLLHVNWLQSTRWQEVLVYIHFTLLKYAPKQMCQPYCIYKWKQQSAKIIYHATYMPHIKIRLYTDIQQWCQYICLIWTQCNQHCDQIHWYIPISRICHWANMSTTLYIHVPLHCCCRLHIEPTLLHTLVKNKKLYYFFTMLLPYMCQQQVCLLKAHICHMWKLVNVHQWVKYVNIYAKYELPAISYVVRNIVQRCKIPMLDDDDENDDATASLHRLSWPLGQSSSLAGMMLERAVY